MNIADEATTAHLKAEVHPFDTVVKIPLATAIQTVNTCFERWGLPQQIKIDNGFPFVNPRHMDIPTKAKLWWIGLGINVIQNRPSCPQENGAVECLQGIMNCWSNPKGYSSIEAFQKRLNEESNFQRNGYRMPNKKNYTRKELFPELETNKRRYNPKKFQMKHIYKYLSRQAWTRKVSKFGEVSFFGKRHYLGAKNARHVITVTFDPIDKQWMFHNTEGKLLKLSKTAVPKKEEILNFAMMSKNLDTT